MAYFARELAKANVSPTCSLKAANPTIVGALNVFENGVAKTLYVGTQYDVTIDDMQLNVPFN